MLPDRFPKSGEGKPKSGGPDLRFLTGKLNSVARKVEPSHLRQNSKGKRKLSVIDLGMSRTDLEILGAIWGKAVKAFFPNRGTWRF